tara:strand:- start:217 stop:567 length:351 start_codon:yes stop_codon:yes gene_type:complete
MPKKQDFHVVMWPDNWVLISSKKEESKKEINGSFDDIFSEIKATKNIVKIVLHIELSDEMQLDKIMKLTKPIYDFFDEETEIIVSLRGSDAIEPYFKCAIISKDFSGEREKIKILT